MGFKPVCKTVWSGKNFFLAGKPVRSLEKGHFSRVSAFEWYIALGQNLHLKGSYALDKVTYFLRRKMV
jgi:hypothetical protein